MRYKWNEQKNEELKKYRGISFDEMVEPLNNDAILDVKQHPNKLKYPKQFLMYIQYKGYVYIVPFVYENKNIIFLKTIFKSRKAKKEFNI
ncbi:MAG: toxin [Patescibacteria group bacterium]